MWRCIPGKNSKNTSKPYYICISVGCASFCDGIFSEINKKNTREKIVIFHQFYKLVEDIKYVMKYLEYVPQFFSK